MKPCCEKPENLREVERDDARQIVVRQCQECGAKHYELTVDPLKLGVRVEE